MLFSFFPVKASIIEGLDTWVSEPDTTQQPYIIAHRIKPIHEFLCLSPLVDHIPTPGHTQESGEVCFQGRCRRKKLYLILRAEVRVAEDGGIN
jgi:hypothetical protein